MLVLKPENRIGGGAKVDEPETGPRLFAVTSDIEAHAFVPEPEPARPAFGQAPGPSGAGAPAMQAPSRNHSMLPLHAAAFPVRFGGAQAALECTKHFNDCQMLIDRVSDMLGRQGYRMHPDAAALVADLIEDARMFLEVARRNHEQPQNPYDHARAYAKADLAIGHARAAELIQSRCSQR